jgi:hypothetical protein
MRSFYALYVKDAHKTERSLKRGNLNSTKHQLHRHLKYFPITQEQRKWDYHIERVDSGRSKSLTEMKFW